MFRHIHIRSVWTGVFAFFASCAASLFAPLVASAHEVYVLDQSEIAFAMKAPRPDFLATISTHLGQFALWGSIVVAVLAIVFFFSISRPVEKLFDPYLAHLKRWAPRVAQATLGAALAASGYYRAIFGVELPLHAAFGGYDHIMAGVLLIIGAMLVFGILPRVAGIAVTAIFVALTIEYGVYMLNYATYLGEGLTIALFGGAYSVYSNAGLSSMFHRLLAPKFHAYKFLIMRALFGVSLIYASLYAKFIYGALALEVVTKYNLTHYFPFDPVFLVLGAMLIEILLGLCFVIGFEARFASLFFLVFLCLSIAFFGESVWPHIILIGTAVAMFMHGYDRFSLSVKMEGKGRDEPVM